MRGDILLKIFPHMMSERRNKQVNISLDYRDYIPES